jgi:hypothetical protein
MRRWRHELPEFSRIIGEEPEGRKKRLTSAPRRLGVENILSSHEGTRDTKQQKPQARKRRAGTPQPRCGWGMNGVRRLPRVARSSQPRALRHNPFGIGRRSGKICVKTTRRPDISPIPAHPEIKCKSPSNSTNFIVHWLTNRCSVVTLGYSGSSTFLQRGSPPPPPWRLLPGF